MIRLALAASLVCACKSDPDMYPINPGGGGTGGTFVVDAAENTGDGSSTITGRACLIADPRSPTTCASTGADGLTVVLGDKTATTAVDGSFTIDRPAGNIAVWGVSGTGVQPSAMRFGTSATIPVLSANLYDDMVVSMNAVVTTETGAIIAQVRKSNAAVVGAVATPSPAPDSSIYYDGASATNWDLDATGSHGVVWVSAIAPGSATLAIDNGVVQGTIGGIPVFAGMVTFELAAIP